MVEYMPFTGRHLSNPKTRHKGNKTTGGDIRLQVLQKDHVVTAKTMT